MGQDCEEFSWSAPGVAAKPPWKEAPEFFFRAQPQGRAASKRLSTVRPIAPKPPEMARPFLAGNEKVLVGTRPVGTAKFLLENDRAIAQSMAGMQTMWTGLPM